jgi:hypothetical protein
MGPAATMRFAPGQSQRTTRRAPWWPRARRYCRGWRELPGPASLPRFRARESARASAARHAERVGHEAGHERAHRVPEIPPAGRRRSSSRARPRSLEDIQRGRLDVGTVPRAQPLLMMDKADRRAGGVNQRTAGKGIVGALHGTGVGAAVRPERGEARPGRSRQDGRRCPKDPARGRDCDGAWGSSPSLGQEVSGRPRSRCATAPVRQADSGRSRNGGRDAGGRRSFGSDTIGGPGDGARRSARQESRRASTRSVAEG